MNNEWVQDPKVFNINREKAHASIHRYASLEEMHTNKKKKQNKKKKMEISLC